MAASVEKLKIDEKEMHPNTLPTAFGTRLSKNENAGGAGITTIFAKRDTSPTWADYDNDLGKSTPLSLLDKMENAGGASERTSKLKTTSGILELMDDDRPVVGTESDIGSLKIRAISAGGKTKAMGSLTLSETCLF